MDYPPTILLTKQRQLSGKRISLLSPAKINLYLNVVGRYEDGFHNIETIVNRVTLFDKITVIVKKSPNIEVFSNLPQLENEDNLCFKAASLLKKRLKVKCGFSIYLEKNIPIGAGLGGGSSNAATTILAIIKLLNLNVPLRRLYRWGEELGSDVNFFFSQVSFALLKGKGGKVFPLDVKSKLRYLIIYPQINLSTKLVYEKMDTLQEAAKRRLLKNNNREKGELTKFFSRVKILIYALKRKDYLLIEKGSFNMLERSVFSLYRELEEIKVFLRRRGFFCQLTGAGSSLFSILKRENHWGKGSFFKKKKWLIFEVSSF
ncbi:MAG: 4-(cytidine 5'-diphospho)-2-C-methyl-D-erythritol kinase [Candidatus Omnitrophica bacterium 4484_70.2]|nr:MAG: 4-(cytidine 5'-diphospho)-2-C-methyl-D-erythritol kinase [Candidatus Omnitrophica bacterium 4484_70.2]